MKILMFGILPPPINGQAIITKFLYETLKEDFDVIFVDNANSGNNRISFKRAFYTFSKLLDAKKVLKVQNIDVIYFVPSTNILGHIRDLLLLYFCKSHKVKKYVIQFHSGNVLNFNKLFMRFSSNALLKKADKVIFSSEILYKNSDLNINNEKVEFIPNTIRTQLELSPTDLIEKLERGRKNKKMNILYLSNLIESKGYFDVLKAAKLCKDNGLTNISFTFAGKFKNIEQKKQIEQFIKNNNMEETINFIGEVEDYKDLLIDMDVFILPTYYQFEAQPIAIIEALNAGLIILTTEHGGIPDLVENQRNGFYVKSQCPKDIFEKITYVFEKKDELSFMKKENFDRYQNKYKIEVIKQKYKDLFSSLEK